MSASNPETDIRVVKMPDRVETFRVIAGKPKAVVGYIRLEDTGDELRWVARNLGDPSGKSAADIKRFTCRYTTCRWLLREVSSA